MVKNRSVLRDSVEIVKEMRYEYEILKMTSIQLSKKYGVSIATVISILRDAGTNIRNISQSRKLAWDKQDRYKYKIDKDWLKDKYINCHRPICDIAKEIGCDASVVSDRLRLFNIQLRDKKEVAQLVDRSCKDMSVLYNGKIKKNGGTLDKIRITYDEIYDKYVVKGRGISDICKDYHCNPRTIVNKLNKYGIKMRNIQESHNMDVYCRRLSERAKNENIEHDKMPEYPKEGDMINGELINKHATHIWHECPQCHIGKWIKLAHFKKARTNGLCNKCCKHDEITISKIIKANLLRPTCPESEVLNMLDVMYPNEWKYTGDGDVIIGCKNPDIININGYKAVIEINGTYWHSKKCTDECPLLHELDRIEHYKQYGYKTLVIWEHELKHKDKVIKKIQDFYSEISKSHH